MKNIKAIIFDAYGTLFDVNSAAKKCKNKIGDKWEAFGFSVLEIDGHNMEAIINACSEAKATQDKPTIIIAHTILGKGVSFMENRYEWHGAPPGKGPDDVVPKDRQLEVALQELQEWRKEIMKHEA